MRVIAINLPQFHKMPINDRWWGEGFTDWTKVRGARPLIPGHEQPVVPLDGNYYDMSERSTLEWQTACMKAYGVYGMAYYHYWYNDRPLMEKPLENLLRWKDIDQPFMLFWSNCDWYHSQPNSYQRAMMLRQEYGTREQWVRHIRYMIPFFQDSRYIRWEDKPILCIYRPGEIPNFDGMIECFREECRRAGLKGLYVVEHLFNYEERAYARGSDAVMYREPNCVKKFAGSVYVPGIDRQPDLCSSAVKCKLKTYDYGEMVQVSTERQAQIHAAGSHGKKAFYGAFTGWDNTPRHGYKGFAVLNSRPDVFRRYLAELERLCEPDDFLFINAWNEWAEGMHLEPDAVHGYGFLEAVRDAVGAPSAAVPVPPKRPEEQEEPYEQRLIRLLERQSEVVLYGAGVYGQAVISFLQSHLSQWQQRVRGFLDDTPEKIGQMYCGLPVFEPGTYLRGAPNALVLLCCDERSHGIMTAKLAGLQVSPERIVIPEIAFIDREKDLAFLRRHRGALSALSEMLGDELSKKVLTNVLRYKLEHDGALLEEIASPLEDRYFERGLLKGHSLRNYLDCGAYTGDSLQQYLDFVGRSYGQVICCEADQNNARQIIDRISREGLGEIRVDVRGIWSRSGRASFVLAGEKSGYILVDGARAEGKRIKIDTTTIDELCNAMPVDFIKLEIDGAEYEGILGGIYIIRTMHPVVAVSVYHHREDILRIPLLLKALYQDYELYLRYYGRSSLTDIVCYAIPADRERGAYGNQLV